MSRSSSVSLEAITGRYLKRVSFPLPKQPGQETYPGIEKVSYDYRNTISCYRFTSTCRIGVVRFPRYMYVHSLGATHRRFVQAQTCTSRFKSPPPRQGSCWLTQDRCATGLRDFGEFCGGDRGPRERFATGLRKKEKSSFRGGRALLFCNYSFSARMQKEHSLHGCRRNILCTDAEGTRWCSTGVVRRGCFEQIVNFFQESERSGCWC